MHAIGFGSAGDIREGGTEKKNQLFLTTEDVQLVGVVIR